MLKSLLYYDTVHLITVMDIKMGIVYRIIQILILVYIIAYTVILQKGYQANDFPIGHTTIKVKGSGYVVSPNGIGNKIIWDALDIVQPNLQICSVFLTTNYLMTRGQVQGTCNGDDSEEKCPCTNGKLTVNGMETGQCNTTNTPPICLIEGWCPTENEPEVVENLIQGVENLTIFMRSTVDYTKFNITRSNAHNNVSIGLNIFYVSTILSWAQTDIGQVASKGAVLGITAKWDCDLDRDINNCLPTWTSERLDDTQSSVSTGFNYRKTDYYYVNGTRVRDITKLWGIWMIFSISGVGRKFNIVALTMTVGSGLAFMGIAALITDIVLLKISRPRKRFKEAKYTPVNPDDEMSALLPKDINGVMK